MSTFVNIAVYRRQQVTEPRELQRAKAGGVGPAAAALFAYPGLKYGLGLYGDGFALSALAMLAAYVLGVYLCYAVAIQAMAGRWMMLVAAMVAGIGLGLTLCPPHFRYMMALEPLALGGAAWLVGSQARTERRQLRLYLFGLAAVAVVGIAQNAPTWPQLQQAFGYFGQEIVIEFKTMLETAGYPQATAAEFADSMSRVMNGVARVAPAATVFNLIAQFSVGFVAFLAWGAQGAPCGRLTPFRRWKVPFALIPVVALVIVARLVFDDPIAQVADNLLLIVSIYYCLGGLALFEHMISRVHLPWWARVLAFLMLLVLGILGYLVTVLLGFIDSFADWRKISSGDLQLDKG